MNLFFRLVFIFLRNTLALKRVGILDETVLKFRVWLTDQDMFAHMTNSRYLSFADLGTINYIMRSGCWPVLRKRGWFPVILSQEMIISRMLKTPQKFEVRTHIAGWDATYIGLRHSFYRKDKKCSEVKVLARFASQDRKKVSLQDVVDALQTEVTAPVFDQDYLRMIEQVEAARAERDKEKPAIT